MFHFFLLLFLLPFVVNKDVQLYLRVEYNVNEYAVTGVMNTLRKFKAVSVFSVLA